MLFVTAFLTGLFGSFHCAGMCGPIAFALPGRRDEGLTFYAGRLIYNLGRMSAYALLGVLSGAFGLGLKLAGMQQSLSIAAGVLIFLSVAYSYFIKKGSSINPFSWMPQKWTQQLFHSKSVFALGLIGLLNGFLPCGFVYIAILGASVTQGLAEGALFMICFGLGTLPMMYGVSILGQFLSSNFRSRLNKLSPILAFIIAGLFILRGLNLGIPYLSPEIRVETIAPENCH